MPTRRTTAAAAVLIAVVSFCLSSSLTATPVKLSTLTGKFTLERSLNSVHKKDGKDHLFQKQTFASNSPMNNLLSPSALSQNSNGSDATTLALGPEEKNSFYEPVEKNIEGWKIRVDPKLIAEEDLSKQVFTALANHLQRVKYIVPAERVKQLQQLPIWIDLENPVLKAMQYHPSRGWLLANNHDPRLVKHVHIPQARDLLKRSTWAKHPYVVLHELAHAYHDQVLSFDAPAIVEAYEKAKDEGIYEEVLLFTGRKVRHYGLSNPKEYFAESTEAYFGVNDFYPFVRAELKEHDPRMYEVMKSVWGPVD